MWYREFCRTMQMSDSLGAKVKNGSGRVSPRGPVFLSYRRSDGAECRPSATMGQWKSQESTLEDSTQSTSLY